MSHLHIPTAVNDDNTESLDTVQNLPMISPNRSALRASWRAGQPSSQSSTTSSTTITSPSHTLSHTQPIIRPSPTSVNNKPIHQYYTNHTRTESNTAELSTQSDPADPYQNSTAKQRQSRRRTAPVNGFAHMVQSQLRDQAAAAGNIETPTGMPFQHKTFQHHDIIPPVNTNVKLTTMTGKTQAANRRASVISPTGVTSPASPQTTRQARASYNINALSNLTLIQQCISNTTAAQLLHTTLTSGFVASVSDSTTQHKHSKHMKCWCDNELGMLHYTPLEATPESILSKLSLSPANSKSSAAGAYSDTICVADIASVQVVQPLGIMVSDGFSRDTKFMFDNKVEYSEFLFYIEYCLYCSTTQQSAVTRNDTINANKQRAPAVQSGVQLLSLLVAHQLEQQRQQQSQLQLQQQQMTAQSVDVSRGRLPLNRDLSEKIQAFERELERCYTDHSNLLNQERKHTQPLIDQLHNLTVEHTWLKAQLKQATPKSGARLSGNLVHNIKFSPLRAGQSNLPAHTYVA